MTEQELEALHIDLCYKFDVYRNWGELYISQMLINGEGKLCLPSLEVKDKCDEAKSSFEQAYKNYQDKRNEFIKEHHQ